MDALLQDLRFALRSLRRTPGFTLTVIAVMALGIGVNSSIYTAVRAVLFASLPFAEPDRMVQVQSEKHGEGETPSDMSMPDARDVMERARTLHHVACWTEWNVFATLGGEARRYDATLATAELPKMLGVAPAVGRWFTPDECRRGSAADPVVLGDRIWRDQFGGDRAVLGHALSVNGRVCTVVGVMPPGFRFPNTAEMFVPLAVDDTSLRRGSRWLSAAARLAPRATLEQAGAELATIADGVARENPVTNKDMTFVATPFRDALVVGLRPALLMMALAVLFVLLIVCANVANLMLARAASRQREVGVRIALGGTRLRLVRQMITESLLLAVAGGVLGVVLGQLGMRLMLASIPIPLSYWIKFDLDPAVLGVTLAVTVLAGLAFGLAPALHATSGDLLTALREGTPGGGDSRASRRFRGLLVVAEVALAVVLLIGSGLMVRSFLGRMSERRALHTEGVLTGALTLPASLYKTDAARVAFFDELRATLAALPGVRAVGGAAKLHLGASSWTTFIQREGMDTGALNERPRVSFNVITPGYLDAVGIRLLKGRDLSEFDAADAPRVCLVNEAAARTLWPGADPIGQRLHADAADAADWISVVGVVASVRQRGRPPERPLPEILVPHTQHPNADLTWAIRTSADPGALAGEVRSLLRARDPNLAFYDVRTLGESIRVAVWEPRLYAQLMSVFSLLALVIAGLGIYGVMAYTVAQRTREIGIRMALGAAQADVQRLVVGQASRLTLLGAGLGLALAFGLTRFMQSQLFGIHANDPPTFAAVTLILALSSVAAAWLPTARAVRVDPVVALRHE